MAFFILPVLLLLQIILAAAQEGAPTLTEILTPNFADPANPNEALRFLFTPPIATAQTPIAIRYVLFLAIPKHEVIAACDPVVLSFFGTKDSIPSRFCNPEGEAVIVSYIRHRLLASYFPLEAGPYGQFLVRNGLNPFSTSIDTNTLVGWANVNAQRLRDYFDNDGWNGLGDETRNDFRLRYEDTTGYRPANPAFLPVRRLRRPLRWQPLTGTTDMRGNFAQQVHVTPHIGKRVAPLVLSDISNRTLEGPYKTPNRRRTIGRRDKRTMLRLISKLFKTSASLTTQDVALSYFFESKGLSIGQFVFFYQKLLGFGERDNDRFALGEILAQHDAVMLAWREKVRNDLVRPVTMIRRLLKGRKVRAYRGFGMGVGVVKAEEWEPVVPIQPHSEFPSGSAVICKATTDHLKFALQDLMGNNGTLPPIEMEIQPGFIPGSPVDVPVTFRFESLDEAAEECGRSRLLAGVHFEPSIPAGFELSKDLGKKAFEHVADLYAGRVPKDCARCIRS